MKISRLLLIALFSLCVSYGLSANDTQGLYFIKEGNLFGYMNAKAEIVIKPQFEWAEDFTGELARYRKANRYGFINRKGEVVIKAQYKFAMAFSEGLAAVFINGKWGYINQKGEMVIKPEFPNAKPFFDGLAAVMEPIKKSRNWGYIDKSGKMVLKPAYEIAMNFSDGLAGVIITDPKTNRKRVKTYIDKSGKEIFTIQQGVNYITPPTFSGGLVGASSHGREDKLSKFHDPAGKAVCTVEAGAVQPFSEGLAAAKPKYVWGFINKKGEWAVKPQFGAVGRFSRDLAKVQFIKRNGMVRGLWGYINKKGELVIKHQFKYASDFFKDDIARVVIKDKYAYIDKTGNVIWKEK